MDKRDGKFGPQPAVAVPPVRQMSRIDQPIPPHAGYAPQQTCGQPYGYPPAPQAQGYPPPVGYPPSAYPQPHAYPPPGHSRWSGWISSSMITSLSSLRVIRDLYNR